MTQPLLFAVPPRPRKPRRWLMHVSDAAPGPCDEVCHRVRYQCARCGLETDWQTARTVTEAKRGIPCSRCNEGG